jgi:hypothetical protein
MRKVASLLLAGILGLCVGVLATWDRGADPVTQFNAGFSDSKLDDCQQGLRSACEWLSSE